MRKITARLNFKLDLGTLHNYPGVPNTTSFSGQKIIQIASESTFVSLAVT